MINCFSQYADCDIDIIHFNKKFLNMKRCAFLCSFREAQKRWYVFSYREPLNHAVGSCQRIYRFLCVWRRHDFVCEEKDFILSAGIWFFLYSFLHEKMLVLY